MEREGVTETTIFPQPEESAKFDTCWNSGCVGVLIAIIAAGKVTSNRPMSRVSFPENTSMMRSEGYLQVREAAQLLGVCPNTIRVWGAAGKIPEYRHPVNNYRLYKRTELERIMSRMEKTVPTGAEGVGQGTAKVI